MEYPSCDFCNELNGRTGDLFSELLGGVPASRVIFEIGDLRLFPSLGEIIQGHLLIAPTYHVTSSLNFCQQDKKYFPLLITHIRQIYNDAHGGYPVFFEHGDPTGTYVFDGQCISHAHVHVLPTYVDLLSVLNRERPPM